MISADDARLAMLNRQGAAYDQAVQRVSIEQMARTPGASALYAAGHSNNPVDILASLPASLFPAGLFPEAELKMRGLYDDYKAAWKAHDNGDTTAVNNFFDEHPEYEARIAMLQDPTTRLRSYLINDIWNAYSKMPALDKKTAQSSLGALFQDAFLSNETRSYDSISDDTLASWAKALGGTTPQTSHPTDIIIPKNNPGLVSAVQTYEDQRNAYFPNIYTIQQQVYSLPADQQSAAYDANPVLKRYSIWRNSYLASNPSIIPYVESKDSELYGLSGDIQTEVYQFRAQRDKMFPNLDQEQNEYFSIPQGAMSNVAYANSKKGKTMSQRALYLQNHPDLANYWNWRTQYAAQYPQASPYILSESTLSGMINGTRKSTAATASANTIYNQANTTTPNQNQSSQVPLSQEELNSFTAPLVRQLLAYFASGTPLTDGATKELDAHLKASGRGITLDEYIGSVLKPAFQ